MRVHEYRILLEQSIIDLNRSIEALMKPIDNSWLQWQPKGRVRHRVRDGSFFWYQRMVLVDIRNL